MSFKEYTPEEQDAFIELAKEVGIAKAMKTLGYPAAWGTANNWCKARGVVITVDSLRASATATREWYKDEEVLRVAEAGMEVVFDDLTTKELLPDEVKKLSEAYQKFSNQWMALKGKTQTISETRSVGETDLAIKDLIAQENARNKMIEEEANNQT